MYKPRDGRDGRDGDDGKPGRDGKDADVRKIIDEVLRRVPKPRDGIDGKDGQDALMPPPQTWQASFTKDEHGRTAFVDVVPTKVGQRWRITPKHEGDLMYYAEITPIG